jgi:hypothetical protein
VVLRHDFYARSLIPFLMRTVACLYIDPRGPYPKMPGTDCWDEKRDAMLYTGPHPVVAHPPCGPWGRAAKFCRQDPAPALRAVEQVREHGGVLEHPADSLLWRAAGLPSPGTYDIHGGTTIRVCQVEWGHVARKKTWLYLVRVPPRLIGVPPYPGRQPTHWCRKRPGQKVPEGIKMCSKEQRRRTPDLFAEWLVTLARGSCPLLRLVASYPF